MMEWNLQQVVFEIFAVASPNQNYAPSHLQGPRGQHSPAPRAVRINGFGRPVKNTVCSATWLGMAIILFPVHHPFHETGAGEAVPQRPFPIDSAHSNGSEEATAFGGVQR